MPEPSQEAVDDLRGVIDHACEAVSKGDSPGSVAAYIWSNVSPCIAKYEGKIERLKGCLTDASMALHEQVEDGKELAFDVSVAEAIRLLITRANKAEAEVEKLREGLAEFDAWLSFRGEFREVLTALRSVLSDRQEAAKGEKCERCGGTGEIVHPPSRPEVEHGESRRWHELCPDCKPEEGK